MSGPQGGRAAGFAADQAKQLHDSPGNLEVAKDLTARTIRREDGSVGLGFIDSSAQTIPGPPGHTLENGDWVISGNTDNLPGQIRKVVEGEGWQSRPYNNPDFNIHEKIQNLINTQGHEIFVHGNTVVSVDAAAGTVSMQDVPSGINIYGHLNTADASLVFDPQDPANKGVDWNVIRSRTGTEGWGVGVETIPGKPGVIPGPEAVSVTPAPDLSGKTVVDTLLEQPPEALKAKGIIETDQFKKTWNFHVLRPDIVDSSGQHTHRELALQLGGKFQVASGEFRTGTGAPGSLGFSDEIGKGLTPSHLPGVPAAEDKALSALIDRSGGLIKKSDMVYIIDLTNGKQITIPMVDQFGNSNLPQEFFDSQTGGLRGVDTIAAAVLEKSDGTVLRAGELLNNGQIPGGTVVHSLASEKFLPIEPSPAVPPVTPPTPEPEPPHIGVKLVPPPAVELIPPGAKELGQDLLIPIPFAPRHPLGPAETGGGVYYDMPLTEERKRLFEQNRSRTLRQNPSAVLDPRSEVGMYFDRQTPEYMREVRQLAEQIQAPVSPNLKAIVCIPVAGHEEGEHIYDTLLNYGRQKASADQYEILLFVNHPEGTNLDKTRGEIERFQRDHPSSPVRMIYKQLPRSQAKMAVIRKYLNDVAILRTQSLINRGEDPILISNDADLRGVAPEYISNFINKFNQNPRIDALVGQLDWDPASYIEYPAIHVGTRLFQYLNLLLWRGKSGDRSSSGANTALRASIYAGIGGYQINDMPGAEDVILGQAIRAARNSNQTIGYAGARVSRLYTSPRRAIDAWAAGFPPIQQWDRNWGAINEQVRRIKLGEHQDVNYDDPAVLEKLKIDLEKVIGRTLAYYGDASNNPESPLFKKAVSFLGIAYRVNPQGNIEITDMNKFIQGIKLYQEQGIRLQKAKTGQLSPEELITQDRLSKSELIDTEKWAKKHHLGRGNISQQQLENWTRRAGEERHRIQEMYPGNLPPQDPPPRWNAQQDPSSILSGNIASISNALQGLGLFNPNRHSEAALLATLGGTDYVQTHRNGISAGELARLLQAVAPELNLQFSNSVSDLLGAIKNGAAVIFEVQNPKDGGSHTALIPPGQRISRRDGQLMVQIIDPTAGVREIPVEDLIKSRITLADTPSASMTFVLEHKSTTQQGAPAAGTEPIITQPTTTVQPVGVEPIAVREGQRGLSAADFYVIAPRLQNTPRERAGETLDMIAGSTPRDVDIANELFYDGEQPVSLERMEEIRSAMQNLESGRLDISKMRAEEVINSVQKEINHMKANPVETAPTRTGPLPDQINRHLAAAPTDPFKTTPQEIEHYLKTLKLGSGATIEEMNSRIDNGKLLVNGRISAKKFGVPVGDATFSVRLENNPAGGMTVTPLQMTLTGLVERKREDIDNAIANLNNLLTDQLNKQINPTWQVANFRIEGNELAFNFKKK